MAGIVMFVAALLMLGIGFGVAFTFGAVAMIFGFIGAMAESFADGDGLIGSFTIFKDMFAFMPYRIYSIMENKILIAVPLFVFMGIVLQKAKLAEKLLESIALLFGEIRGGIAISTVLVGALLAASTGVVGASVVAMGVISLPVMLKYKYNQALGCGTICAAGTLGQIIPPSIVLIILGDIFAVPVGDLFHEAIVPGLVLVGAYVVYILIISYTKPDIAPAVVGEYGEDKFKQTINALKAILPPLLLVVCVLGSIFMGIATPTESSAFGCVGAVLLSFFYRSFSFKMIKESLEESVKTTALVFAILIGATAFSLVFSYTGGDEIVEEFMLNLPGEKWGFIIFSLVVIFVLGFFIDFVEISYIVLPILVPIATSLGINPSYFAIVIAMNLQTSFLTPPFGFSLFFLRSVAPPQIQTSAIYKGVVPFIAIQILVLIFFTYWLLR
ncbi:TRAP transporter large permease subunit [Campylobacter sp. faydin G-24]|uniref:TRAP transporter large permease subunit n=1 Tax=Campylobacter anatolicus TaxID=2829105 RepID=A0ABS5HFR5_9BACT|nr:TRAP transporter large permease subunit [Campylobacter anatolicus]MBR8463083.1 TRAP transporter large permease subunit [Campylobacter anatolicus]